MRYLILTLALLVAGHALGDRGRSGSTGERTIAAHVVKVEKDLLHVAIGDAKAQNVIVPTTDKTEIRIDGERAKLADLTSGLLAEITQVDGVTTVVECKRSKKGR